MFVNQPNSFNTWRLRVWRTNAHKKAGSWWPAWFEWLTTHSGKKVSARPLASLPYQSITAAPGRYVQQKNS
ncbi:MAG: hypothetical protein CMF38_02375 [Legionellaceae bacterium]|nr:hypothetical protein [Legionellaceae bacterium]HAF86943.1 hypothetical protein [Legionellales bacterium]HCA89674.1 hypothetical protein [Legionellales bacterium]|tara:strand:+ start:1583 stop:1795 length:213 start_codon:yes stop_codon:yes gene_type:complete